MLKDKIIIFTGPSGVGKATIEKELFKDKELKLTLSVSATTRKPREGEVHGEHYYFISHEEFDKLIAEDAFVEWNAHFSNRYGTLKSEMERIQKDGETPFLEVEVIGAKNILEKFDKKDILSIFIAPPSLEDLKDRIRSRGSETDEQLSERFSRVEEEMSHIEMFDHVVVNDKIKSAVEQVKKILKG